MNERAENVIRRLHLQSHPEGGYFLEIYRSEARVTGGDGRRERASVTSIYFLLARNDHSKWHVLESDEVWHYLEGDPLELIVIEPESMSCERKVLGPLSNGQSPAQIVPAGHWQAARPLGEYTLAGCTVAPGFVFEDFLMLRDDDATASRIRLAFPDLGELL